LVYRPRGTAPHDTPNRMARLFQPGPIGPSTAILVAVLVLALLVVERERPQWLEPVHAAVLTAIAPLQWALHQPVRGWQATREYGRSLESLRAENQALRDELRLLHARTERQEGLERENHRLRALLNNVSSLGEEALVAEVIADSPDPFRQRLFLNRSATQGLYQGQAVIDAFGLVGQLGTVGALSSELILITDPAHATPVKLQRSGQRAVALGVGRADELEIAWLPRGSDVREGDLLITSGLDGRFPPNYPVATVISVERDDQQPFLSVRAQPIAGIGRLQEVLLLWRRPVNPDPTPQPAPGPPDRIPAPNPSPEP